MELTSWVRNRRFRKMNMVLSLRTNVVFLLCTCICSTTGICQEQFCSNGGICTSISSTDYFCNCATGFAGSFCEYESNSTCARLQPCGMNGYCVQKLDGSFTCSCTSGYSGTHCENDDTSMVLKIRTSLAVRVLVGVVVPAVFIILCIVACCRVHCIKRRKLRRRRGRFNGTVLASASAFSPPTCTNVSVPETPRQETPQTSFASNRLIPVRSNSPNPVQSTIESTQGVFTTNTNWQMNGTDPKSGQIENNINEMTPPPSYESVVGQITDQRELPPSYQNTVHG